MKNGTASNKHLCCSDAQKVVVSEHSGAQQSELEDRYRVASGPTERPAAGDQMGDLWPTDPTVRNQLSSHVSVTNLCPLLQQVELPEEFQQILCSFFYPILTRQSNWKQGHEWIAWATWQGATALDSEIAGRKHFHHYTHLASKHQGTVQGVQFVIFVTTCLFCVQIVLTRGNEKNSHDLSLALIQMSFSSISMKQVLEPSF